MAHVIIEGLVKRYAHNTSTTVALQGVELRIGDGEFITLVGASGCGKSTLLRILAGLETYTEGRVLCGGQLITGPGADRAMVFQHYSLYPWLTVMDNIKFSRRLKANRRDITSADVEAASGRADALLDLIGLSKVARAYPSQLSGGMQQRVAIARALVMEPALVLADEPTGNLDTASSDEVFALLRRIHAERGTSFIVVTHDPRLAARCDRQVELIDGRIARDEGVR